MKKYFRLYPECYLIPGIRSAVIYNILNRNAVELNGKEMETVIASEKNNIVDSEDELFGKLADFEYGCFLDSQVYIDKLRPYDAYNLELFWKNIPNIQFAIFQITNDCSLTCEDCEMSVCPSCLKFPDYSASKPLQLSDYSNILPKLREQGLKKVILTGGDISKFSQLSKLVNLIKSFELDILMCVNGLHPINVKDKNIEIYLSMKNGQSIDQVNANFKEFSNVTVFCRDNFSNIPSTWRSAKTITKTLTHSFSPVSIDEFFVKEHYVACLLGKLYVNHVGDIYPCWGNTKKKLGNILNVNLAKINFELYEQFWRKFPALYGCRKCPKYHGCNHCYLKMLGPERACCE
ncbi:MAG: hypothetical protein LBB34_02830 [Holosporales bacterium]|jgi:organic radical activating enzyme|nr:hypothetical protein [Holosporales bacterium]